MVFFVLVSIHEWGHYYFAKRAGILVREFAIGFGPKLFSYKRGETRYTLRLLPIGGFVRMAGEDPETVEVAPGQTVALRLNKDQQVTHIFMDQLDQRSNTVQGVIHQIDMDRKLSLHLDVDGEEQHLKLHPQAMVVSKLKETQIAPYDRQFGSKTVAQRSLAIFAGPLMNFILAIVLFISYVFMSGLPVENPQFVKIGSVEPTSVANGIVLPGDIVKSVNGESIGGDRTKLVEMIAKSPAKKMDWIVIRDGKEVTLEVTPARVKPENIGRVGIMVPVITRDATISEAIGRGFTILKDSTVLIFDGFKKLIFGQFKFDDLGGPVRTFEVTGQIAKTGLPQLIYWAGILSLYLGIFNLLPFPALDGSRLVFLGVEAVRGRPVDPNRESMVHFIGFAMIMILMLAVTYNDILRLFKS
ncbi:RIP metalloprotease RseP [Paenibacillus swuensis]|uniref:Zinc metalloprotease n=1 Tax=Paenibacillus swuensis TaxID=1178515 RepID=A0A172TPS1_9BACL|nr:RIP metalloprotease RseP [Paenibacillus swuensis]ANE48966.1 RIP metalloprotease RseP [Paenibacillus swuensis]